MPTSYAPALRYTRMIGFKYATILPLCLFLVACNGPLKLLTGGGPNVAANVQAGAENNQTIGKSQSTEFSVLRPRARNIEQSTGDTGVRTEEVQTVVVEAAPDWVWVLIAGVLCGVMLGALLGWLIETPQRLRRKNGDN